MEGKVTGIGGIFLKFNDPVAMKRWYADILGLTTNDYGVLFAFNTGVSPKAYLQLGTFPSETSYFGSKQQQYMLNFRVDDLEKLLLRLKENNTPILNEMEIFEYGKFIHISDPEGNRIELWEPVDDEFSKEPTTEMH